MNVRVASIALAVATVGAVASTLLALSLHAHGQGASDACDWNNDGRIDLIDINAIRANIGMAVIPAGGKGDPTNDGVITINDVRACTLRCTSLRCAT